MSFRCASIIPPKFELDNKDEDPYLKKFLRNHIQKYTSVNEYLERQFYLLREDCFCNLKNAIRAIRSESFNLNNLKSLSSNVWIYTINRISDFLFYKMDIVYEVYFKPIEKIDWQDSKQLRFGSLLFLSNDCFKNYCIATVSESNDVDLRRGVVKIQLIENMIIPKHPSRGQFIMLELQPYFEAYVHVLKRLQNINEHSFPFSEYILYNQIKQKSISIDNRFIGKIKLNTSQQKAFQSALSQDLSIIQGPPGTGKSTLGCAIVENILKRYDTKKPILVVCYTNHALDQFLEKILAFCEKDKIVRIGSQSESQEIKSCNINVHVDQWKSQRRFPKYLPYQRCESRKKMNEIKDFLSNPENKFRQNVLEKIKEYELLLKQYKDLGMVEHRLIMETADVVGITTTACARYADVLDQLQVRTMIIEEAAEILEAHVMCSIGPQCRQLIMIGDHKQLQPSVAVYDYHDMFDLNCSLFERLIDIGFQFDSLTHQRRMRPEISRCILPVYPRLQDHRDVSKYPNVKGTRTNIYFFHHTNEESIIFETSFKNDFEVQFVEKIYSFLLDRGNDPDKITILSTYKGQNCEIRKRLKLARSFTVDNYQGEENDIIILSLVRSNPWGRVGFLKKENRITVALSRARHGLFMIGNLNSLRKYPLWFKMTVALDNMWGSQLPITCKRKESHHLIVTCPIDFSRNDLCAEQCQELNSCGKHICGAVCHDNEHPKCTVMVMKMCQRNRHSVQVFCQGDVVCKSEVGSQLKCGHIAKHQCGECAPKLCKELVSMELRCSHFQSVVCGTDPAKVVCDGRHSQELPCGHSVIDCIKYTGLCDREIDHKLECGHKILIKCFQKSLKLMCLSVCTKKLNCGHAYKHLCNECSGGHFHKPCKETVEYKLPCQHEKMVICSKKDESHNCYSPCKKLMPCSHFCTFLCDECENGQHHKPCIEIIDHQLPCQHYMKMRCSERNKLQVCYSKCDKRMVCGHVCQNVCKDCHGGQFHGACTEIVTHELSCTHYKSIKCSTRDLQHPCFEICKKRMVCGHTCSSVCKDCDGGACHLPCTEIIPIFLPCGHWKQVKCSHKDLRQTCSESCQKVLSCGHQYPHLCHECDGGNIHKSCNELIIHPLRCRHNKSIRCSETHLEHVCYDVCLKKLPCGHKCKSVCHECEGGDSHAPCKEIVCIKLNCGHEKFIKCHQSGDEHVCESVCSKLLICGHGCMNLCVDCSGGRQHGFCISLISHKLPCDHSISIKCSEQYAKHPCELMCNKVLHCGHHCSGSCQECLNGRLHTTCRNKCAKILRCGHKCSDICHAGKCQTCVKDCLVLKVKNFEFEKQFPDHVIENWIKLKDSLDNSLPVTVTLMFNDIIKYMSAARIKEIVLERFNLTYNLYKSLLEFYNKRLFTFHFDGSIIYKEHILISIFKMLEWLNPISHGALLSKRLEFEMEFERIKDIVKIGHLIEKEESNRKNLMLKIINDLIDTQYTKEKECLFKQKIITIENS